ncbi:MAG TPA: hypothetical protein VFS97_02350 [Nitrososphaeraceae archaeon]|nr:hypothetical protein [Nitrososphaeraceae archaeon]
MNTIKITFTTKKSGGLGCLLLAVLLFSIFFVFPRLHSAYGVGVGVFSKGEKPFGISYDDWASRYWNKWIAKNTDQATPKPGGCLTVNDANGNKSESMVMLMETADVNFPPTQECKIFSNQGIIIPLWVGWCDNGGGNVEDLSECARQQNLGNIRSEVKVDGVPIAKLDVRQSLISGKLDYKINSLTNVTDSASKEFTLTIPPDTHKPNQVTGTWRAVSQGWWVFLKPFPPGEHTIFYNIRVTPTGPLTSPGTNPHFADITYKLQVNK